MKIEMKGNTVYIDCRYKALPKLTGTQTFFSWWTSSPLSVMSVMKVKRNAVTLT